MDSLNPCVSRLLSGYVVSVRENRYGEPANVAAKRLAVLTGKSRIGLFFADGCPQSTLRCGSSIAEDMPDVKTLAQTLR